MEPNTFHAKLKNKRNPLEENFLYFRKWKPQNNFLCFLKRKHFLYFRKRKPQNGNSEKLLLFQEVYCKARKKKFLLKTFLVSCNVLAIFASVEHMEITCEAKNKI